MTLRDQILNSTASPQQKEKLLQQLSKVEKPLRLLDFKTNKKATKKEFLKGCGYFKVSKETYEKFFLALKSYIYEYDYDLFMCFLVNPRGSIGEHLLRKNSYAHTLWINYMRIDDKLRLWGSKNIAECVRSEKGEETIKFEELGIL